MPEITYANKGLADPTRPLNTLYGTVLKYLCPYGKTFPGGLLELRVACRVSSTNEAEGVWDDTPEYCGKFCKLDHNVIYATVTSDPEKTELGALREYTCDLGYVFSEGQVSENATCYEISTFSVGWDIPNQCQGAQL